MQTNLIRHVMMKALEDALAVCAFRCCCQPEQKVGREMFDNSDVCSRLRAMNLIDDNEVEIVLAQFIKILRSR